MRPYHVLQILCFKKPHKTHSPIRLLEIGHVLASATAQPAS